MNGFPGCTVGPSALHLPGCLGRGLLSSLSAALPDGVGHVVADGREHLAELGGEVVEVKRAHAGQVRSQVPVDPGALDADQRSQVKACPRRIWGGNNVCLKNLIYIFGIVFAAYNNMTVV